jgi:hypothetical protein
MPMNVVTQNANIQRSSSLRSAATGINGAATRRQELAVGAGVAREPGEPAGGDAVGSDAFRAPQEPDWPSIMRSQRAKSPRPLLYPQSALTTELIDILENGTITLPPTCHRSPGQVRCGPQGGSRAPPGIDRVGRRSRSYLAFNPI